MAAKKKDDTKKSEEVKTTAKGRLGVLKGLKKNINKKHGKGTIGSGFKKPLNIPRISTGSIIFDYGLGGSIIGSDRYVSAGVPVGRGILLHGEEQSGKSTAAYRIAGVAQKLCANCYRPAENIEIVCVSEAVHDPESGEVLEEAEYESRGECHCYEKGIFRPRKYVEDTDKGPVEEKKADFEARIEKYRENSYEEFRVALIDMENSFEPSWGQKLGVDSRTLVHVVPDTGESAIDMYMSLAYTGSVDLLICDSIAALTPSEEIEASAEDQQMGIQARMVNKFSRKAQSVANAMWQQRGMLLTQIWINQEREKIGISFGDSKVLPAGHAQKFFVAVRVQMWASKWEKEKVDVDLNKDFQLDMGKEVRMNFKIKKNKTASAQAQGGYVMTIRGRDAGKIVEFPYLIAQAEKYGMIRGEKSKYFLGDKPYKRKGDLLADIENNPEIYRRLRSAILIKMFGEDNE